MQSIVLSPYDSRPNAPSDPSTPCFDGSQVQSSSFFNSKFKFLVMLQGSQMGPTPVMPWGGSPIAGQTLTWPPPPSPAGY
jgi:hypothetical protein